MFLEPVAGLLKFPKVCKILGSSSRYLLHLLQLQKKQPSNHNLGFARKVWTFLITANIKYWSQFETLHLPPFVEARPHGWKHPQSHVEAKHAGANLSVDLHVHQDVPADSTASACFSDFSYCLKLGKHDSRNWNCVDFFLRIRLQGFWSSMGKAASYLDEISHGVFELHILWHAPHAVRTRHGCRFTHCSSTLPAPHRWLFFNRSARSRIGFLRCGLNTCLKPSAQWQDVKLIRRIFGAARSRNKIVREAW